MIKLSKSTAILTQKYNNVITSVNGFPWPDAQNRHIGHSLPVLLNQNILIKRDDPLVSPSSLWILLLFFVTSRHISEEPNLLEME